MDSFSEHYDLHRSIEDVAEKFVKSPDKKICRFCNSAYPEVSFNTIPHVIPELFGKNKLTSNFECDECNKRFQKFETDTSTMIQHYLSILQLKTKNGVPTFQSFKKPYQHSTTIKSVDNSLNFNFGANLDHFEYDEENKSIILYLKTKKFRPFFVYKTFLKIGLSLLTNEELAENIHYLDYLNSDEPIDNGAQFWTAYRYVLKTKYYPTPNALLYKAKNTIEELNAFPEYVLILYFANVVFQFFLPISKKNINEFSSNNNLEIVHYPSYGLEDLQRIKKIEIHSMDLNEINQVSFTDIITLYYDQLEKDVNHTNKR